MGDGKHEWISVNGAWRCDRCGLIGGSGTVASTSHVMAKCQGFVEVLSRIQCSECPTLRARLALTDAVVDAAREFNREWSKPGDVSWGIAMGAMFQALAALDAATEQPEEQP